MVDELWKFSTRRTGLSACNWPGLGETSCGAGVCGTKRYDDSGVS